MNTIKTFINAHPTLKRYLISSTTTFLATFLLTIGVAVKTLPLDTTVITATLVLSIIAAGFRAAVKAVVEMLAGAHADLPVSTPPTV